MSGRFITHPTHRIHATDTNITTPTTTDTNITSPITTPTDSNITTPITTPTDTYITTPITTPITTDTDITTADTLINNPLQVIEYLLLFSSGLSVRVGFVPPTATCEARGYPQALGP